MKLSPVYTLADTDKSKAKTSGGRLWKISYLAVFETILSFTLMPPKLEFVG